MKKFKNNKGSRTRKKKTHCKRGHDISIVARDRLGRCNGCFHPVLVGIRPPKSRKKRFCLRGHDTRICGRSPHRVCRECARLLAKNHKNRDKKKQAIYMKKYRLEHKKEIAFRQKKYNEEHKNEIYKTRIKYTKKHKKLFRERKRIFENKKRKTDIVYRLLVNLRNRLVKVVKRKSKTGSAVRDLGCTGEFLRKYLESKFYANMTWDNYGTYWEIDHIVPFWKFDLTNKKQFLKAVNYKNLQPLTKKDHQHKTAEEKKLHSSIKLRENHPR